MSFRHGFNTGRYIRENEKFVNIADFIENTTTSLNQHVVTQETPQFVYKSSFPISTQRDNLTEINNGEGVAQEPPLHTSIFLINLL